MMPTASPVTDSVGLYPNGFPNSERPYETIVRMVELYFSPVWNVKVERLRIEISSARKEIQAFVKDYWILRRSRIEM